MSNSLSQDSGVLLDRYVKKKLWRKNSKYDINDVKADFPELDDYVCIEIMLDWIGQKSPKQDAVTDLWDRSVHFQLNQFYQDCVRRHITTLKPQYKLSYVCRTRVVSELKTCQVFELQEKDLVNLLQNQKVGLTAPCSVHRCDYADNPHNLDIRLSRDSMYKVDVVTKQQTVVHVLNHQDTNNHDVNGDAANHDENTINQVANQVDNQVDNEPTQSSDQSYAHQRQHTHTTEDYKHWFILLDNCPAPFVSLVTKNIEEITTGLKNMKSCRLCVLMS